VPQDGIELPIPSLPIAHQEKIAYLFS